MLRLACLLTFSLSVFAASFDPSVISADRQWVAYLDVDTLRSGEIGAYLLERINEEHGRKIDQFIFLTGLDPRKDISSITVAGIDDNGANAVCIFKGTFDGDRLNQLARLADDHSETTYRNCTVHAWTDKGKTQAGCLVRTDLLLFGESPDSLLAAIDVLSGTAAPAAADSALLKAIPSAEAPFLMAAAAGLDGWKGKNANSQIIQQMRSIGVTARESKSQLILEAHALTNDEATAKRLRDMGQGLLALAAFNQDVAKQPVAQQALQSASLQSDGATISATMSCDLESLRVAAEQKRASK